MHQFLNQKTIPIVDKKQISENILSVINSENWRDYVIAQDDDNDYSESGYFIVKVNDNYGLYRYSHCSCFGTWEAFSNNNLSFTWVGTKEDLLYIAKNNMDPSMPDRKADPEDYDYDHLSVVYAEVIKYLEP